MTPRHGFPFGCFTNTEKSSIDAVEAAVYEADPYLLNATASMDGWLLLEAAGLEGDEQQ